MAHFMNHDTWPLVFSLATAHSVRFLATIRSVDRTWFYVTERMPQLWTRVTFNRRIHFTDPGYVDLYLKNSGVLPLEVCIEQPTWIEQEYVVVISSKLRRVLPRIRSLKIYAPIHEDLELLISLIGKEQPAPLLQELVLGVETLPSFGEQTVTLPISFLPSHNLVRLELPCLPVPHHSLPHLSTITSLTIDSTLCSHYPAFRDLLLLIEAASNLQHFVYKGTHDFSYDTTSGVINDSHTLSLPNLRTVTVSAPGSGTDLLRNFHAPRLTEVRLDGWSCEQGRGYSGGLNTRQQVAETLRRISSRSPKIRRLELLFTRLHHLEDYGYILNGEGFPSLEELVLNTSDITDEALVSSSGSRSRLKKLVLKDCKHVSGKGLKAFVMGRSKTFSLSVAGCRRITQHDVTSLSENICVASQ